MKKNYLLTKTVCMFIGMVLFALNMFAQPAPPAGLQIQARDVDRAIIRWTQVDGAEGYKVFLSTNGEVFTEAASVGDVNFALVEGLDPATEYTIRVSAVAGEEESETSEVALVTTDPGLHIHLPLDELREGNNVYEAISGALMPATGQLVVEDAEASGLGISATKFVQDELDGIASYAKISNFFVGNEINANLMSRTISMWVRNELPSAYTVPLSIEKRTGMTIAFKNDSIWAFTKHRPQFPAGTDWVADGVGVPFSGTDWTLVTWVYDDPYTKIYLNGELAGTSPGGTWAFPRAWQVEAGGDKSAEIGSLFDPCAALVQYLGDTWDPGPRHYFSGSLADIRMYNYALSDEDIMKAYQDVVAPPAPTNVFVQARDVDRAIIRWSLAEGATGYKVYVSADGETFTEAAEVGAVNFALVEGLVAGTEYVVHVVSKNEMAESAAVAVALVTSDPGLHIHLPLDELREGNNVYEAISGALMPATGQLVVEDAEASGLGISATKFVQDELEGIASYAKISNFFVGNEINANLMSRTISMWVRNELPSAYTVPLSIEKRTGMTIAFKNDSIWAFTKHRPQFPAGTDWVADGVGVPFSGTDWTLVTWVYDDPYTKIYLNGELAGTSPGGTWAFPRAWQVEAGGDKSAEIGSLFDPCAALVQYLGDTWDPGPRHYFSGSLADIRMYNYALSDEDIMAAYTAVMPSTSPPTNVFVQARDVDRAIIRWSLAEGATGYKVYVSADGETYTESAVVEDISFAHIHGLSPATTYHVRVVATSELSDSQPAEVSLTTVDPELVIHVPLDILVDGNNIYEAISAKLAPVNGEVVVHSAQESGLGIPASRFIQDELDGIASYAKISNFIFGNEFNDNLMSRTISFWVKNENPDAYTVPLSIEKRTGMTIAFKNDSIYALTKHRPRFPAGTDWVADMVGAPYGSPDWNLVTWVYDDPYTKLYLNGELVGTSPGGEWIFPAAWQVELGGDKSAEIGCLFDPCAGLVQYLQNTWDPGPRNFFSGSMADIRMYNHARSEDDILNDFAEMATVPTGFMVAANGVDAVLLRWNDLENETGYIVEHSLDGTAYTTGATLDADITVYRQTGLNADTEYHFRLTPVTEGLAASAFLTAKTLEPAMVVQFNFEALQEGAIVETLSGETENFFGDFSIDQVKHTIRIGDRDYELSVNALKIVQDELEGIQSYARLFRSLLPLTPSWLGRSMTFWIKNDAPDAWSVPFSVEKRTGFGIAFKNDSIWAFTKHRPRYPAGTDWVADGVGYPYGTSEWTHVAYVYDDPHTHIFLNGVKAATSEGGTWMFPTSIQIEAGGDKSASIGCLLDPDASMVQFLGDTWDPGTRRFFSGSMADIRFFNHGLRADAVASIMMESLQDVTSVKTPDIDHFKVYPNPARDVLYVRAGDKPARMTIFSSIGSVVLTQEVQGNATVNISHLGRGIYFIRIEEGSNVALTKISVVK